MAVNIKLFTNTLYDGEQIKEALLINCDVTVQEFPLVVHFTKFKVKIAAA